MLDKMRSLRRLIGGTAAAACLILAGTAASAETYNAVCFAPAEGVTKTMQIDERDGPYKLALVNGFAGNDWRIQMIQSVKAWAAKDENKKNIDELAIVSVGNDAAAQISAVDNYIAAGYDGIIFIAVNPTAFDAVIKRADRAGTVLVPFDNVLDTDRVVQVNEPQKELGALKAKTVLENISKANPRILEVRGLQGNSTDRDRHLGARAVLDPAGAEVIEVVGNWDTGTVQKVVADALATHGQFDGVVCQHGCAGAINAMLDAGHPVVPIGADAENGVRILMAKHSIPGVSAAQAPAMSVVAMMATVAQLQGHELPQLIHLPIPHVFSKDLKDGVNYFTELPASFNTGTGFKQCDLALTPDELLAQSPANE
ncbi:MAG: sugar ABC transporter substrate-binding protein [Kiloniellales bacterium]